MTQPIQNTDSGDEASTESNDSLLKLVLLFSLMGMAVILPKLLSEKR